MVYHVSIDPGEGHFISCGADWMVRIWSMGMDLWGSINQQTEKVDKEWSFPDSMFTAQRDDNLYKMDKVLKDLQGVKNSKFKGIDPVRYIHDLEKGPQEKF